MNNQNDIEKVMMYAPLTPCKHHVSSSKIHPYFGQHKESIVSKKVTIFLKSCGMVVLCYLYFIYALPKIPITTNAEQISSYIFTAFLIGFGLFQIYHLFHRVELFETGMVYQTLCSRNEHAYDELYDIQLRYDEQFDLDQRRHGILWYIFAKRFYRYYIVSFTIGKGLKLRPRIFRHLEEKLTDLQRNLIEYKI